MSVTTPKSPSRRMPRGPRPGPRRERVNVEIESDLLAAVIEAAREMPTATMRSVIEAGLRLWLEQRLERDAQ